MIFIYHSKTIFNNSLTGVFKTHFNTGGFNSNTSLISLIYPIYIYTLFISIHLLLHLPYPSHQQHSNLSYLHLPFHLTHNSYIHLINHSPLFHPYTSYSITLITQFFLSLLLLFFCSLLFAESSA